MSIKVKIYNSNSNSSHKDDTVPFILGQGLFNEQVKRVMSRCEKMDISLINCRTKSSFKDNFYIILKQWNSTDSARHCRELLQKYLPSGQTFYMHRFFKDNDLEDELFIFEIKHKTIFGRSKFAYEVMPYIYDKLTSLIITFCNDNDFLEIEEETYSNLHNSYISIDGQKYDKRVPFETNDNQKHLILPYIISQLITDNHESLRYVPNMFKNCYRLRKLFHDDILVYHDNRYRHLIKTICALYKIGIEQFSFPEIVNEIISQFCSQIKNIKKSSWYLTCSALGCLDYKNYSDCRNVISPFNHMYKRESKSNYEDPTSRQLFGRNKYINSFCRSSSKDFEDFIFMLVFFTTLAISNRKCKIMYDWKIYNNTPPILINIADDFPIHECQAIFDYLQKDDIALEKNLKPNKVLYADKKNRTVVFLDIDNDVRFNMIKLFTTYGNAEKCKNKLMNFGSSEKSRNKRHYSMGIYSNDKLKSYIDTTRTKSSKFEKSYLLNFNRIDSYDIDKYNKISTENFLDKVIHLFSDEYCVKEDMSRVELYIKNHVKETKVNCLNSNKSYSNLLFSCVIFVAIYNAIKHNNEKKLIFDISTIKDAEYLTRYIENILLESQVYFHDPIKKLKATIINRLINGDIAYCYVTEREIFKFINKPKTNKYANFALEELLKEKILTEIIPLARGKRKGPKGRMFLVEHGNIPHKYKSKDILNSIYENSLLNIT